MEERTCDIIVLGGGPAGMTAAIYAKRANLDVVLLETNVTGGLVISTYTVENFPSYPELHGMELMEKMREHVDHMGVEVEEVCEVTGLELGEDEKAVHGDGIVYKAPAIILATGRKPIALDVPTECDQMHFCAICDGAPYKGKRVLVVGGGNSAFDEGLYLLNLGVAELTVVEIMDRFFAAEATQDALLGDPRVKGFKTTKVVDVEVTDGKLSAAILENAQTRYLARYIFSVFFTVAVLYADQHHQSFSYLACDLSVNGHTAFCDSLHYRSHVVVLYASIMPGIPLSDLHIFSIWFLFCIESVRLIFTVSSFSAFAFSPDMCTSISSQILDMLESMLF